MFDVLLKKPTILQQDETYANIFGIGTSIPNFTATQGEILEFILAHFQIKEKTKNLYRKTLWNKSIEKRHFALQNLSDVLEKNHDQINRRFQKAATELSTQALDKAFNQTNLKPDQIDFLAVGTCTGYLCPGLSSYLIEKSGLRRDVATADVVGMGCGAAIPVLQQAANFVISHPGATAAIVCTEICSAAMFSNDDIDIVISNSLFSDGSAALLLTSKPINNFSFSDSFQPKQIMGFSSLTFPEWRSELQFTTESGYLKNVLSKEVPVHAGQAGREVIEALLRSQEKSKDEIQHWVLHGGGEKIINSLQNELGLTSDQTISARTVLKNFGNMSSPSVLFGLEEEERQHPSVSGDLSILSSFGAGFSSHAALIKTL